MPRKNARPAAKKAAARKKAKMAAKATPQRRVAVFAPHHPAGLSLAALALMAGRLSRSS